MIHAIEKHRGAPCATASCDECGREIRVTCDYERKSSASGGWVPNAGQVHTRIIGLGWEVTSKAMRCPACVEARKAPAPNKPKEKPMTTMTASDLRQPTREQRRMIMDMLQASYDTKAERYMGAETDKTVADAIGNVMPGWVAAIREEFFGPDGGNEAIEILRDELRGVKAAIEKEQDRARDAQEQAKTALAALDRLADILSGLQRKYDAVKASLGPRAARL